MNRLLLFIILFLVNYLVMAKELPQIECLKDGKFQYIQNQKTIVEKSSYCWSNKTFYIADYACHLQLKKCEILKKRSVIIKKKDLRGLTGTPSFKVCHILRGSPRINQFWDGKEWRDRSICIFADNSFVGVDHLATLVDYD